MTTRRGGVDTFNLNIKKLFVKGLSLSVGRQNLTKGEGSSCSRDRGTAAGHYHTRRTWRNSWKKSKWS